METEQKRAKAKINADFLGSFYYGIGSCMEWSETEWNTAGNVGDDDF
ncbi:MAG: hypothetical protein ACYC0A_03875 [Lutibacter sp.]